LKHFITVIGRHGSQHYDTQDNDTQHKDTQQKDTTRHKGLSIKDTHHTISVIYAQ
jgi:hypothetical protein